MHIYSLIWLTIYPYTKLQDLCYSNHIGKNDDNYGPRRNGVKNSWGLKLHYFLVGWKMVVGISNSFYLVFSPCLAPLPNFIQIRQKTRKFEIFTFGRFWLVGLIGRKMVVGIVNSLYVVFAPLSAPIPNFIQIGQKTQ